MFAKTFRFSRLPLAGAISFLFMVPASGQSPPPLVIQAVPTGQRPLGVEAVVANSGENSVSVFEVKQVPLDPNSAIIVPSKVIGGVASPFGVVSCGLRTYVTSPSTNSIYVLDLSKGTVTATVHVGSQPYSADCYTDPGAGFAGLAVSNYGDSTLSVVDISSFTVMKTIPNVPGSRGLHGIYVVTDNRQKFIAWVAGTDANVVTLVDLRTSAIVASLPLHGPTAIAAFPSLSVASSLDNSIISFNASTLTVVSTIPGVPSPQDLITNPFSPSSGYIASTGKGNSIAWISGTDVTLIPGIPGAAGLAGGSFVNSNPLRPNVANYILVTSPDSNSVFFIEAKSTGPLSFNMVNGASFSGPLAPGSLASAIEATGVSQNFAAGSLPLPRVLGGVTLSVGGALNFNATSGWTYSPTGSIQAPLLFVGPNQINFQIPAGITLGSSVPAQLTRPDGTARLGALIAAAASPGIFTVLQNGQGQAAVLNQDNSQNFGTNPAKLGSVIQIFATGAGDTTPTLLPGEAAPASGNPLVLTQVQPTVTIGGISAPVLFTGMAPGFVGLWQINAQVPQSVTPGNAVPLVVNAGAVASNTVTIAVQ